MKSWPVRLLCRRPSGRGTGALTVLSLVLTVSAPARAQQDEEIAKLKEAVRQLQQRLEELEARQKRATRTETRSAAVTAGYGRIKVGGLMQTWYGATSKAADTFRLRRMELKLAGAITSKWTWTTMVDVSKVVTLNTSTAGGTVTGVSVNNAKHILQDMHVDYALRPDLNLRLGQFKVPLSMEGLRSSAQLLTVERALFNTVGVNGGRVGDIRDVGLQVSGESRRGEFAVGVFNDGGALQNSRDDNAQKTFVGRFVRKVRRPAGQALQFGVYGATGKTGTVPSTRDRIGLEFAYGNGLHRLEAEVVRAKDGVTRSQGGYLVYAYQVNDAWQAVARYDQWDPSTKVGNDKERDYLVGVNYYLRGVNAKVQLNLVRKDMEAGCPLGASRTEVLANVQTAW